MHWLYWSHSSTQAANVKCCSYHCTADIVLYSRKFLHGANFCVFCRHAGEHKNKNCKNFNELLKVKLIMLFQDQGINLSGSLSSASSAAWQTVNMPCIGTKIKWRRLTSEERPCQREVGKWVNFLWSSSCEDSAEECDMQRCGQLSHHANVKIKLQNYILRRIQHFCEILHPWKFPTIWYMYGDCMYFHWLTLLTIGGLPSPHHLHTCTDTLPACATE